MIFLCCCSKGSNHNYQEFRTPFQGISYSCIGIVSISIIGRAGRLIACLQLTVSTIRHSWVTCNVSWPHGGSLPKHTSKTCLAPVVLWPCALATLYWQHCTSQQHQTSRLLPEGIAPPMHLTSSSLAMTHLFAQVTAGTPALANFRHEEPQLIQSHFC